MRYPELPEAAHEVVEDYGTIFVTEYFSESQMKEYLHAFLIENGEHVQQILTDGGWRDNHHEFCLFPTTHRRVIYRFKDKDFAL